MSQPEHYTQHGIELLLSKTTLSGNAALAGIKHLNRLEQVLAQAEWDTDDTAESLMLDTRGNAIEGTRTNFFTVHGNELYTPDLTYCGVEGVMRAMLLDELPKPYVQTARAKARPVRVPISSLSRTIPTCLRA